MVKRKKDSCDSVARIDFYNGNSFTAREILSRAVIAAYDLGLVFFYAPGHFVLELGRLYYLY